MYVHVSVGRKHSSQNIRGGNKIRLQEWHVRAISRPSWSSARNRDMASPADHAYFALGRNRVCVTLPSDRSAALSSTPGHFVMRTLMTTSPPRNQTASD